MCLLLLAPAGLRAQQLELLYNRHAAYHSADANGQVHGLLVDRINLALQSTAIHAVWREVPVARQREELRGNEQAACVVGALKTPDRVGLGKFSAPFYRALPIIAVSRADNPRMVSGRPLRVTLEDPQLTLLAKDGYTFGAFVTAQIERSRPKTMRTLTEVPNMVAMLGGKRADYMFMAEDAFAPLVHSLGYPPGRFKITRFSDMPEGNERYLWCSLRVPDAMLAQLNRAFARLPAQEPARRQLSGR